MSKKYMLPIQYVKKNKDVLLTPDNLNEADLLLFSMLPLVDIGHVGIPLEGDHNIVSLKEIMDNQYKLHKNKKYGLVLNKKINKYLNECAKSQRYTSLKFYNLFYKLDDVTQSGFFFCDLTDDITFVVFAATDDTIVGWIEDLMIANNPNVECAVNGKEYANRNCKDKNKKYIFVGHSKGGYIANYALLTVDKDIQKNIAKTYNMDGPGFTKEFINQYQDDSVLKDLISICPHGSIIGRLFEHFVKPNVIHSTYHSLLQHNPVSWAVANDFTIYRRNRFGKHSTLVDLMIKNYFASSSEEQIINLENGLIKLLKCVRVDTLTKYIRHPFRILKGLFTLPKPERKIILGIPRKLIKCKHLARKQYKQNEKQGN